MWQISRHITERLRLGDNFSLDRTSPMSRKADITIADGFGAIANSLNRIGNLLIANFIFVLLSFVGVCLLLVIASRSESKKYRSARKHKRQTDLESQELQDL